MGLDLVKHDMGGGDIQNKHRIFAGLARDHAGFCKKCLYSNWDSSSSGRGDRRHLCEVMDCLHKAKLYAEYNI